MDYHVPVLLNQVLKVLDPQPGKIFIDATLGHAGHTLELLKKGSIVFGIDQDPKNLSIAQNRIANLDLSKNFHPIHGNFANLFQIFQEQIKQPVDGLLLDLGLSFNQITAQNRGFSFDDGESLDMRLDPNDQAETAENIINTCSFDELYQIFTKFAQEKYSHPIILRIIRERQKEPIKSAKRLSTIIQDYYESHHLKTKINPATKILMALRIAVNDEYKNLLNVLETSLRIVKSGGAVAVISFHSGEDRLIKQFIKKNSQNNFIVSISKAISPDYNETKLNPLSRSSLLRSYTIN